MSMMTSQILKFVDFTKTQKSRYLGNETIFVHIKKSLITHQGLLYGKKHFVEEVTLKHFMKLLMKLYDRIFHHICLTGF